MMNSTNYKQLLCKTYFLSHVQSFETYYVNWKSLRKLEKNGSGFVLVNAAFPLSLIRSDSMFTFWLSADKNKVETIWLITDPYWLVKTLWFNVQIYSTHS